MINRFDSSSLTVADMIARGADSVSASCWGCGKLWRAPIIMLPPETTLAKVNEAMFCHACGSAMVHAEPIWPDGGPKPH
jgi:hypothetical protein